MAAHAPHPHYLFAADFSRLFPQMVGASVVAHIFALLTFVFLPKLLPTPPPLPKTITVDFDYNLPKGPNIGPIAPAVSQTAVRLQNTDGAKAPPKQSADEVRLKNTHVEKTNKLGRKDRQLQEAVDRLRHPQSDEIAGGGGTAETSDTGLFASYMASLQARIMSVWSLPGGLPAEYLQKNVVFRIYINADGSIARSEMTQPSGFEPLDRSCNSAILRAGPFTPPPVVFADKVRKGVSIRFHPLDKQH